MEIIKDLLRWLRARWGPPHNLRKLSWIYINERGEVLFMRKASGDVFFEPGCWTRWLEDERVTLANKIKEDLGIELELDTMLKFASFKAQAYGKPPDTTIEFVGYFAVPKIGSRLKAAEGVEIKLLPYSAEWPTSEGGAAFKYLLFQQGYL